VVEYNAQLPDITTVERKWMKDKFYKFSYITKKFYVCTECNTKRSINGVTYSNGRIVCPECGNRLQPLPGRFRTFIESHYFTFMKRHKDFQVLRTFYIVKRMKVGRVADYHVREVYQHWIRWDSKSAIMAISGASSPWTCDCWGYEDTMTIKNNVGKYQANSYVYSTKNILPILRRNGFNGNAHGIDLKYLIIHLLSDPIKESIFKAEQFSLFERSGEELRRHWQQIRIAMRHNYIVSDAGIWFDHIFTLNELERDYNNPLYLLPDDLNKEHQRLIEIQRNKRRKENLIKLKKQISKNQRKYRARKKRFFNLQFTGKNVQIKMLKRIRTIMEEGDALNICTFINAYYKKEDSVMFSAYVNKEPVEVIEFSLSKMKVVQSRGLNNNSSKYHKEILRVMEKNTNQIKQVA